MISLIGKKVGMTQVFNEKGELVPVTVVKFESNVVVAQRETAKDGYDAVVIGTVETKESKLSKPVAGQFKEVQPQRHVMEFRGFEKELKVGDSFGVELLDGISFVDVTGTSKGKGYAGVMKKHGFGGGRATHGSKFHREAGGTGMATTPGRVIRNTKMAGRMGSDKKTVQNLELIKVDTELQVALIKGAVPGKRGGLVVVRNAKKK
ncbi:MAG: 50S ribosomal protein L3 [Spirochaetales bacterium]|nr:50S ribosomal protein L3 [Spirochaetales bacterium]